MQARRVARVTHTGIAWTFYGGDRRRPGDVLEEGDWVLVAVRRGTECYVVPAKFGGLEAVRPWVHPSGNYAIRDVYAWAPMPEAP